jgi:hypothetical protein
MAVSRHAEVVRSAPRGLKLLTSENRSCASYDTVEVAGVRTEGTPVQWDLGRLPCPFDVGGGPAIPPAQSHGAGQLRDQEVDLVAALLLAAALPQDQAEPRPAGDPQE